MRFAPVLRVLGTLVYGFIGWELGVALARTNEITSQSAIYILPATLICAVLGYVFSPWLVMAPAQAARNSLRQVPIDELVAATVGLAIGLLIAALLAFPLSRLPAPFGTVLPFIGTIVSGYLGAAVLAMRREDIFSFIRSPGTNIAITDDERPNVLLLDTSVIIDGRIADIAEAGFLLTRMAVPRFVLNELQHIADSSEVLRRNRGRRGLEMLDRLQNNSEVDIEFIDQDPGPEIQQVDDKLISLGQDMGGAVVTNDYNLNRVAKLQGVRILNINELANAVKSVFLPGEEIPIKIIQEGKEANQGVGYLDDGTMVVVENGRRYVNQEVLVQVTKVLQTNAGRLIFAMPDAT